jgi:hypothetical protein
MSGYAIMTDRFSHWLMKPDRASSEGTRQWRDGMGSTELATLQRGFSWLPATAGQVMLRTPRKISC